MKCILAVVLCLAALERISSMPVAENASAEKPIASLPVIPGQGAAAVAAPAAVQTKTILPSAPADVVPQAVNTAAVQPAASPKESVSDHSHHSHIGARHADEAASVEVAAQKPNAESVEQVAIAGKTGLESAELPKSEEKIGESAKPSEEKIEPAQVKTANLAEAPVQAASDAAAPVAAAAPSVPEGQASPLPKSSIVAEENIQEGSVVGKSSEAAVKGEKKLDDLEHSAEEAAKKAALTEAAAAEPIEKKQETEAKLEVAKEKIDRVTREAEEAAAAAAAGKTALPSSSIPAALAGSGAALPAQSAAVPEVAPPAAAKSAIGAASAQPIENADSSVVQKEVEKKSAAEQPQPIVKGVESAVQATAEAKEVIGSAADSAKLEEPKIPQAKRESAELAAPADGVADLKTSSVVDAASSSLAAAGAAIDQIKAAVEEPIKEIKERSEASSSSEESKELSSKTVVENVAKIAPLEDTKAEELPKPQEVTAIKEAPKEPSLAKSSESAESSESSEHSNQQPSAASSAA